MVTPGNNWSLLVTSASYVTSLVKSKSAHVEIWCGESHGAISVFTMKDGVVTSLEVVNHNDPVVENVEVFQVSVARWQNLIPSFP